MQATFTEKQILTISELNRSVKRLLEENFQILWVEGEISNLSKPQSGHIYFTLKDEQAQVRCALFRLRNYSLPFELENGMQILAYAKISLYEGRGDYQLIIEHIEERGEGLLRRRFELLKNKLAAEGIFDARHKKPLPSFPQKIGVITSATGAAIKDVLSVLKRRFASIPIIIYPTSVQGEIAAGQIANAITIANQRKECDVLILCRGGGSLEDLFAFNEEIVARAIFHSYLPIVSGIGHEVDITIADFVSDQRAATPSAAAELLSPDKKQYQTHIANLVARLIQMVQSDLRHRKMVIKNLRSKLLHPKQLLQRYSQHIDILTQSLIKNLQLKLESKKNKLQLLDLKLKHQNPKQSLQQHQQMLINKFKIFTHLMVHKIQESKQKLAATSRMLNAVNPLHVLERGYSITTFQGKIVDDIAQIKIADKIKVEVKSGSLLCKVEEINIRHVVPRSAT